MIYSPDKLKEALLCLEERLKKLEELHAGTTIHNQLDGLQGGSVNERFHLTRAERDTITVTKTLAEDLETLYNELRLDVSKNKNGVADLKNKVIKEVKIAPKVGEPKVKVLTITFVGDSIPEITAEFIDENDNKFLQSFSLESDKLYGIMNDGSKVEFPLETIIKPIKDKIAELDTLVTNKLDKSVFDTFKQKVEDEYATKVEVAKKADKEELDNVKASLDETKLQVETNRTDIVELKKKNLLKVTVSKHPTILKHKVLTLTFVDNSELTAEFEDENDNIHLERFDVVGDDVFAVLNTGTKIIVPLHPNVVTNAILTNKLLEVDVKLGALKNELKTDLNALDTRFVAYTVRTDARLDALELGMPNKVNTSPGKSLVADTLIAKLEMLIAGGGGGTPPLGGGGGLSGTDTFVKNATFKVIDDNTVKIEFLREGGATFESNALIVPKAVLDRIATLEASGGNSLEKGGYVGTAKDLSDKIGTLETAIAGKVDLGGYIGSGKDLDNRIANAEGKIPAIQTDLAKAYIETEFVDGGVSTSNTYKLKRKDGTYDTISVPKTVAGLSFGYEGATKRPMITLTLDGGKQYISSLGGQLGDEVFTLRHKQIIESINPDATRINDVNVVVTAQQKGGIIVVPNAVDIDISALPDLATLAVVNEGAKRNITIKGKVIIGASDKIEGETGSSCHIVVVNNGNSAIVSVNNIL